MRLFVLLIALAFTLSTSAQSNDLLKYTRYRYLYGNATARLQADTVLMTPTDTIYSKDGLARLGTTLWLGNGTYWTQVGYSATSDTIIKVPPGHNGNPGHPGEIRFNDTLFIFQVSKDTVWTALLLEATNGLTKTLDTVLWGGDLNRETIIEQNSNGIIFHDGLFTHRNGDYTGFASPWGILQSDVNGFHVEGGTDAAHFVGLTVDGGGGQIGMQSEHPDGDDWLTLGPNQLSLWNTNGNFRIPFLIDSAQSNVLHYDPATGKVTYSALGVGSGIAAVTAEQGLTATSVSNVRWGGTLNVGDADIDQNSNTILFHDGPFKHGTGDYTGFTGAYSLLQSTDQFFQVDHSDGAGISNNIQSTLASGGYINLKQFNAASEISELNISATDGLAIRNSQGRFYIPDLIDSAQSYTLQYNPTNFKVTYAPNGGGGGGGGGGGLSQNAANGLSMRNDSTVILGGSFDQQTTIDGGASYTMNFTGSRGAGSFTLTAANTSTGTALSTTSANGTGLAVSSTNATGATITAGNEPLIVTRADAVTSGMYKIADFRHLTSGTVANGFGGYLRLSLEDVTGALQSAAYVGSRWEDATTLNSTAELFNFKSGIAQQVFVINKEGRITDTTYGYGKHTGTLTYLGGFTSAGDLIEVDPATIVSGGGGISAVSHDATMTGNGNGIQLKVDTSIIATVNDVAAATSSSTINVAGPGLSASFDPVSGYVLTFTGASGTNAHNALDIRDFGGVADASVPGSGANVTGTNNTIALDSMLAAAADGQLCIIPNGKWRFSTVPDTIATKRVNLLILGDTYHDQHDFIIVGPNSGAFKQHKIEHRGIAWGRVNLPTHSSAAAVGGRVSPNWGTYTGTFIKVYNTDQVTVKFNKIVGFKNGLEVIGGAGNGCQENTFVGGWIQECANGIKLTSLDGNSFVDKNKFDVQRIGGGLCLNIDGYSSPATNGEVYNGAFRSNEFKFLVEFADSAIVANGDITEPRFDITIEGGTFTGILGNDPFRCRVISPNYVRSPKWLGQGYYDASRLGTGSTGLLGRDATIDVPIYLNNATLIGNSAITDAAGTVIVNVKKSLTQATRSALPAYVKTSNLSTEVRNEVTVTTSTYTVGADDYVVKTNGAGFSVVVTLPSASSNPGREIFIKNISSTGGASVSGGDSIGNNTIASGPGGLHYRSNGSSWTLLTRWHD